MIIFITSNRGRAIDITMYHPTGSSYPSSVQPPTLWVCLSIPIIYIFILHIHPIPSALSTVQRAVHERQYIQTVNFHSNVFYLFIYFLSSICYYLPQQEHSQSGAHINKHEITLQHQIHEHFGNIQKS